MDMNITLDQIKLDARQYGLRKLARDTKISRNSLVRFIDEGKDLTTSNFMKLLSALRVSLVKPMVVLPPTVNPKRAADYKSLIELAVEAFDPDEILIFGSQARGDWKEGSDLDLLIIEPRKKPELRLDAIAYKNKINVHFDYIVNTLIELKTGSKLPIYQSIKKESVKVYARK